MSLCPKQVTSEALNGPFPAFGLAPASRHGLLGRTLLSFQLEGKNISTTLKAFNIFELLNSWHCINRFTAHLTINHRVI